MNASEVGAPKATEILLVEPADVARWIGLADASLLGVQLIELPAAVRAGLETHRERYELRTADAASIMHMHPTAILKFAHSTVAPRLGYRMKSARRMLIPAADLAAFIEQRSKPPVPTSGRAPKPDIAASRKAFAEGARRHNLPAA